MSDTKTPGQRAYEQDVALEPTYPDGTPRRPWHALPEWAQWSWERNPTARANARLIAAAPDLLEALQELPSDDADMIEYNPDEGESYFCCGAKTHVNLGKMQHAPGCWYVKLRAAIAKATGGALPTE